MYKHFISLPVNRRFNFTINNFDFGIKKLGGIDLNSYHPYMSFTVEVNPSKFLDTNIKVANDKVETSFYRKPNKMPWI